MLMMMMMMVVMGISKDLMTKIKDEDLLMIGTEGEGLLKITIIKDLLVVAVTLTIILMILMTLDMGEGMDSI